MPCLAFRVLCVLGHHRSICVKTLYRSYIYIPTTTITQQTNHPTTQLNTYYARRTAPGVGGGAEEAKQAK